MHYYYNPVHIIQGNNAIHKIPDLIKQIKSSNAHVLLLTWHPSILTLDTFQQIIHNKNFETYPLCFTASNPTINQLFETYQQTYDFSPDVVIAIGGGSVMDIGKSLCCLYNQKINSVDELRTVINQKKYTVSSTKWIGVPTTSGTGSEVTCWATIWDTENNAKKSVECSDNYAYAAVVDPDLSAGMPISLAVSSALDAVSHAVESYWANASNITSQTLALNAVRLIMSNIDDLIDGKAFAHKAISQGSMLAGLAFSNTKTTACHSISYPLTMHYHIPHGTAVSMLLAPIFKINQSKIENLPLLLQALSVNNADELQKRIISILNRAGIPATLRQWHVDCRDLPQLAAQGITKGRADNNPVKLTPQIIENVLKSVY